MRILGEARELLRNFMRDVIMKAPTKDIMNNMDKIIRPAYLSVMEEKEEL